MCRMQCREVTINLYKSWMEVVSCKFASGDIMSVIMRPQVVGRQAGNAEHIFAEQWFVVL